MTRITLQYFDDCPNWKTTDFHLTTLIAEGLDATVDHESIDSYQTALERGFCGSPTVLIDGTDPFAVPGADAALACRIYITERGPAGSPTIDQLRRAIAGAGASG